MNSDPQAKAARAAAARRFARNLDAMVEASQREHAHGERAVVGWLVRALLGATALLLTGVAYGGWPLVLRGVALAGLALVWGMAGFWHGANARAAERPSAENPYDFQPGTRLTPRRRKTGISGHGPRGRR
jgi:Flp pilus assembly protein TadB